MYAHFPLNESKNLCVLTMACVLTPSNSATETSMKIVATLLIMSVSVFTQGTLFYRQYLTRKIILNLL